METQSQQGSQNISLWITSLAVSVTCCAILFVIFAGYLIDIKKNVSSETIQLQQMVMHQDQLLMEMRAMHHTMSASTPTPVPVVPTTAPTGVPAIELPQVPTPAAQAPETPSAPGTVPAPVTPPAASPAVIPEVPAKH